VPQAEPNTFIVQGHTVTFDPNTLVASCTCLFWKIQKMGPVEPKPCPHIEAVLLKLKKPEKQKVSPPEVKKPVAPLVITGRFGQRKMRQE
jgi:hypothetical protein